MTDVSIAKREPSELEVAAYLRRHPDFLTEFPDLALVLKMPRQVGPTTSLASYQLDVLRDKNRALHRRLQELVAIAERNEDLVTRVHGLTLALMRASSLEETLKRIVATLNEDFGTELVRLVLFRASPAELDGAHWLIATEPYAPALAPFAEFRAQPDPLCGRLDPAKIDYLYGADAARVRSAALVTIGARGMLAVGSEDPNHFYPGMGTLFLKLIAEAIDAAIARFDR
jgi:uncharacterized protein YigA (DUF484 family)